MLCEICGKRDASIVIKVEGATMNVCHVCGKYGQRISNIRTNKENKVEYIKKRNEDTIVEDYGKKIKEARENKGLSLEELAKQINEKLGYLEHIEKEKTLPNLKTARKLERALGIKLIEKEEEIYVPLEKGKKEDLSLMDVAIIEKE